MNSTILHFFFSQYLKLYFWDISKQLKIILQWIAEKEVYVSIFKVYLKSENTCPFVQLQIQTQQISEGRSRYPCRAPRKKWVTWNKPSSDLQILTYKRDGSIETNDSKSELRNHSPQEQIYFTFHSSLLNWEKGEKVVGEGKSYKESFSMLEWSWKRLDELFQSWKKSIHSCKLLCYRPNGRVTLVRAFKG